MQQKKAAVIVVVSAYEDFFLSKERSEKIQSERKTQKRVNVRAHGQLLTAAAYIRDPAMARLQWESAEMLMSHELILMMIVTGVPGSQTRVRHRFTTDARAAVMLFLQTLN